METYQKEYWQGVVDAVKAELIYCIEHFPGASAQEHLDAILDNVRKPLVVIVREDERKKMREELDNESLQTKGC